MPRIEVPASSPYTVHVGVGCLDDVGALVRAACGGTRAAIVTDTNVEPLYAARVAEALEQEGYRVLVHTFTAGEASKRAPTYLAVLEFLCAHEFDRSDTVVALGGGVVGDLAGFAAATYLRGIHLAQVPTSLLAMVDSSVGGKTAIDLEGGKNLVGSFYQPDVVVADVQCLATLTPQQFADGCGEVVKHGVLAGPALFDELERRPLTPAVLARDPRFVADVVARNIAIKRDVVAEDERELGRRKLLNLGHSIGHALEAAERYRLGHGTCVSIGLTAIARAAAARGSLDAATAARIEAVLAAHGLATRTARTADELFSAALHDKKRRADAIDLVIPHGIGDCRVERVDMEEFRALMELGLAPDGEDPRRGTAAPPPTAPATGGRA